MARLRRTRRAASSVRRVYGRARSSRVGRRFDFKQVGAGLASNVGARVGAQYLGPQFGPAAGFMAAGVLMNNPTAQFMAGMALGNSVPLGQFGAAAGSTNSI
jgi:hypothetical protein